MGNLVTVLEKLIVKGRSVFRMFDAAETATGGVPDGTLRLYQDGTNSFIQIYSLATGTWDTLSPDAVAAALYAPIGADYLVGSAHASLTGEIAVGTTPGGELGGTWASPTVDATHSGSAHVTAHSGLSGIGTNDHHNEAHTVASHSDTTATGSELDTLTDGSNADSLHSHTGGMGTLVHSDNTGGSTSSGTESDIVDITGLSIPALHSIRIELGVRIDNNDGGSRDGAIGLHLNGGSVMTSRQVVSASASTDTSGSVILEIPPRATNYTRGGIGRAGYWIGTSVASREFAISSGGSFPTGAITSITIRGNKVSGTDVTIHVNHIRVWELPD